MPVTITATSPLDASDGAILAAVGGALRPSTSTTTTAGTTTAGTTTAGTTTAGTTTAGSTTSGADPTPATVTVTDKFFPADPGVAAFPSPENSRMLRTEAGLSGRPYLLDSTGAVHKLGPVTDAVPNGYTVNGSWAKGGGSDHSAVPQLLVRQGNVFAQANGGPWQLYDQSRGGLYNATLPDAFQTDASGQTTSTVATSSVTMPALPTPSAVAPGSSGRTLLVGLGRQFATVSDAIKAAQAGDTVSLAGETFHEAPPVITVPLKLVWETDASLLDTTGLTTLAWGKGAIVATADLLLVGPRIIGAGMMETSAGGTAAVRPDKGCGYLTIDGGNLTGNQNGVACGDVPVVIKIANAHIDGDGLGDGYTHDVYFSNGTISVELINTTLINPNNGHGLKSRAYATKMTGGSVESFAAASIDLPQGSVDAAVFDGVTIIKKAGAYNHTVLDYATENTNSGNGGAIFRNCIFDIQCDNPVIMVGSGSVVTIEPSCKFIGTKPTAQGGKVIGL